MDVAQLTCVFRCQGSGVQEKRGGGSLLGRRCAATVGGPWDKLSVLLISGF